MREHVSLDSRVDMKQTERDRIARDTEEYLARRKKIHVVPAGVTADSTRPTMRHQQSTKESVDQRRQRGVDRMNGKSKRRLKNNTDLFGTE